ncbi:CpsD/CapB family tyrosine-protein kinase [Paenibacillus thermotolerans]|uniref:CpsD/CapB family tyrosine-protein kinase n=1 Tax=Paenibacillus thermotolerans TaxID=3027807 RepID=UPI0023678D65|nr:MULTISPECIES: CpsD/CapB family tyrosine-protein kinase [unclassified Paenibacillus]
MPRSIIERPLIMDINPRSPISEAYRTLRTNIEFSSVDQEIKAIMITSSQPEEGKTTTAVNLAAAFAQVEKKVVLVDADLRKPTIHRIFNKDNRYGLTNLLANRTVLSEVVADTHIENLSVLTSGPIPPNPAEMLASNRMAQLIVDLKEKFDIVIIDTPPSLVVADALIVAAKCDGVLMVVKTGKVKRQAAMKVKTGLDHVKARLLGVVLNNVKRRKTDAQYYYYESKQQESN